LEVEPGLIQVGELANPEAERAKAADEELFLDILAALEENLKLVFREMVIARVSALGWGLISF